MKQSKRGWLVITFLTIILLTELGYSQETNLALTANPEIISLGPTVEMCGCTPPITLGWQVNEERINDGSTSQFIGICAGFGPKTYEYNATIEFISPSDLNRIEYDTWGQAFGQTGIIITYIYSGGTWQQVDQRNININDGTTVMKPMTQLISSGAPWNNVEKVTVYFKAVSSLNYCVSAHLFEIRAFGVVSMPPANTCSNPDDTIMKLYSSTNSHGALWNDAAYTYDICYSNIFGAAYTGSNPHACTSVNANKVIGLFSSTNAHAEVPLPSVVQYTTPVCYGDLTCQPFTDPTACPADYQTVVRLYQDTNSHISVATDTTYPIKICCKRASIVVPPTTPQVYWADMLGNLITHADIGDEVLMIYEDTDSYDFKIYEKDLLVNDEIRTRESASTFLYKGFRAANWTITQADFDKDGDNEDTKTFIFTMDGKTSGELAVQKGVIDNSPPFAIIDYPSKYKLTMEQRRFKVGNNIDFKQISGDVDSSLKITWEFGDGETYSCLWPQQEVLCNKTHSYAMDKWGTRSVYLRAEEIIGGRIVSNDTEVYIYSAGTNVFAIMNISDSTNNEFKSVFKFSEMPLKFNSSKSYVSKCWAGSCPTGFTCDYTVDDLHCYNLPKDSVIGGIGTVASPYDLWFNITSNNIFATYGNWTKNYSQVVDFTRSFFITQDYKTFLKVGYDTGTTPLWSDFASKEFRVIGDEPFCDESKWFWKEWISGGILETNSKVSCFRPTGVPKTECCPSNTPICQLDGTNYKCVASSYTPNKCSDYNPTNFAADAENKCNEDPFDVAKNSVTDPSICDNTKRVGDCNIRTSCVCYWDGSKCLGGIESKVESCTGPVTTDPTENDGICVDKTINQGGNCEEDDFLTLTITREWIGAIGSGTSPLCILNPPAQTIPCPTKLNFFTLFSFFIAAAAITAIYAINLHRKKRGN